MTGTVSRVRPDAARAGRRSRSLLARCSRHRVCRHARRRTGRSSAEQQDSVDERPRRLRRPTPPQRGESATEIVTHFLDAMTANPIQTSVATQFLAAPPRRRGTPSGG